MRALDTVKHSNFEYYEQQRMTVLDAFLSPASFAKQSVSWQPYWAKALESHKLALRMEVSQRRVKISIMIIDCTANKFSAATGVMMTCAWDKWISDSDVAGEQNMFERDSHS